MSKTIIPLVSVIVPSYNHDGYIENAIKSVLSQDYKNFELIVIDDGSTDDSHAVLSSIPSNPKMTIIINEVNKGQSAVLNQALRLARGEFICLLPSDDWYFPNKLSLQVKKFLECGADVGVVYGRGLRYYSDIDKTFPVNLPMYKGWVLENFIKEPNFVYPVTPMFRKECFDFARPDETYRAEGEAIYLKISIKYKFEYTDDVVAVMRDHSYNTGKITEMMYFDNIRYWNEFFDRDDIPQAIRKLKAIPLSRIHRLKGLESIMLEKNFPAGRAALINSIIVRPLNFFDIRVLTGIFLSLLPHMLVDAAIDRRVAARSKN